MINWYEWTRRISLPRASCLLPWWRHQMEVFCALLAIRAGNSPVIGELPAQRPVARSFYVFFDPNERWSKQVWGWWFETPSHPLWRHYNENDPHTINTSCLSIWFISVKKYDILIEGSIYYRGGENTITVYQPSVKILYNILTWGHSTTGAKYHMPALTCKYWHGNVVMLTKLSSQFA